MPEIRSEASKVLAFPADEIYAVISDYKVGHPAILPKKYFKEYELLEGGQGAGSLIRVQMEVMGTREEFTLLASEPEKNRHLMEVDKSRGTRTSFLLEPQEKGTKVSIISISPSSKGIKGFFERLIVPSVSKKIFREELDILADYLVQQKKTDSIS